MTADDMTHGDERWEPVPAIDGCTFSAYRASAAGRVRSVDRAVGARQLRGVVLAARPNNRGGYLLIGMSCDNPEHKPHKITVHKVILTTFAGPCPPGMEACHGPGGPEDNRWPDSGLRWGTKPENEADKDPQVPQHPCRNYVTCGNMVFHQGRRCVDCVAEVGRQAAALLDAGMNLQDVGEHFGYTGGDWVYSLAVKHGGYAGTKAQARTQHPSLSQRAKLRFLRRSMLRQAASRPGGDAA